MSKQQFGISLVVICVFSFLGGIFGGLITGEHSLLAKDEAAPINRREVLTDHLKTRKLTIVNDQGNSTGSFGIDSAGQCYLETANLKLINPNGKLLGNFGIDMDGRPEINLYPLNKPGGYSFNNTSHGFPILHIGINDKEPGIILYDKDLDERVSIGINYGDPFLNISYRNQVRLRLGTNYSGDITAGGQKKVKGSLSFFDDSGKLLRQLP